MPLINLIEEQISVRRQAEAKARAFFLSSIAAGLVSLGSFGYLFLSTESVKSQTAAASKKMTRIQPIVGGST